MTKCPNCGKLGAIIMAREKGITSFYCNLCGEESHLPIWLGLAFEYSLEDLEAACIRALEKCGLKEGISRPTFGMKDAFNKKGDTTMQVTYNGFTGVLMKLERTFCQPSKYDLTLYDREKQVTHSFASVKLEDVKFLGGAVMFGG